MAGERVVIAVHVDLSESFVDPNGSFYCGAGGEQLRNAAELAGIADWNLYCTDLHPTTSAEFAVNSGLYPIHSVVRPLELDLSKFGLEGKTVSPALTATVLEAVDSSRTAIYVPRQVYFQEADGSLSFAPDDVEATFGARIVSEEQFLGSDWGLVIMPKYFFDATRLTVGVDIGAGTGDPRIPAANLNVFSLIKRKHGAGAGLVFVVPSVVENICTHHTAAGLRQDFPAARVIIPADATMPLAGVGLGFEDAEAAGATCRALACDIGVEYLTTERIRSELAS